ncbi:MAG: hypothetical protein Fur002_22930 [Anaerolineales bacterium]
MNASSFDKVELLRLAFAGLSDDELQRMARLTRLKTYPPGYALCKEGAHEETFYIIAEGEAAITKKISESEGERLLRTAVKGDWVGEMALIQSTARAATVCANTEITVLEMNKQDFETMLGESPVMALDIIRTTLNRMRANDQMAIQDLQRTNKVLRQLDRNKLEFIQVTAHELRTPLTVLKGYGNMLRTFPFVGENDSVKAIVDGILKGAERMHEVVNMMLDVTRLDSETMKVIPTMVFIEKVIKDALSDLRAPAAERNIQIEVHCPPGTPMANIDPSLIQKVIYHVAVNAIKYTPDGGTIWIETAPAALENGAPAVEIRVKDKGIGIDPEHQDLIFEKFYQVGDVAVHSSGKTTFKGGGPGLGLAIAKGIVKAHGGKIWMESAGHDELNLPGSTFFIRLPAFKENA